MKISEEQARKNIRDLCLGIIQPNKSVKMYINSKSPLNECYWPCGHKVTVLYECLKRGHSKRCSTCSHYGIHRGEANGGYKTNRQGFFYIIWNPDMGTYGWIKIGISNNSIRRIAQHTNHWGAEVLSVVPFKDGNIPPQIENEVKRLFGEHIAVENVERMLDGTPLDGYTETYPLTLFNDIEIIMDIVRKYQ